MIYEYGVMISRYSLKAESNLTAYAAMIFHYKNLSNMVAIYSPEECKKDSWLSMDGKISKRLHEIFGGIPEEYPKFDAFDLYVGCHIQEIKKCLKTIKQII